MSETIEGMGLQRILERNRVGGGASRYHPVMMTKLFVHGYMTKICSSRMLSKAARGNVMFMWLAGGQKPDFRTLNDFRGKLLKGVMEEVFVTAVKMLAAKGYIKLEHYFVDGTKIESAAGRYTFVWKKAAQTNDKKLDEKHISRWLSRYGKMRTENMGITILMGLAARSSIPVLM